MGPLTWSETPLECQPVAAGKPPRSPSPTWTAFTTGTTASLHAVTVSRSDRRSVWVVGDDSTILRSKDRGRSWSRCQLGVRETLTQVWSPEPDTAWILGEEHVFRVEAGIATRLSATLDSEWDQGEPGEILGANESAIWIANRSLLVSRDRGITWTRVVDPDPRRKRVPGACGVGLYGTSGTPDELWAMCPFAVVRSTDGGRTWTATQWKMDTEEAVHVSASIDDVWATGQDSSNPGRSTDHGASFVVEPLPSSAGRAWWIWSGGGGWVWVNADGLWVRRGKPGWVRDLPLKLQVRLGGSSAKDVWAVGENGLLLRRR